MSSVTKMGLSAALDRSARLEVSTIGVTATRDAVSTVRLRGGRVLIVTQNGRKTWRRRYNTLYQPNQAGFRPLRPAKKASAHQNFGAVVPSDQLSAMNFWRSGRSTARAMTAATMFAIAAT